MKTVKVVAFLIFIAFSVTAKESQKAMSWDSIKVADNLYMLIGVGGFTGGNLAISVGDDGVVLIDDAMPSTLDIMNKALADITPKSIDFLINTHVHGDHTGNNAFMGKKGAWIVAQNNMRRHLLTKGVQGPDGKKMDAPKEALPVITFSESMDFHLNGMDAHIFHLPHAHTDGDAAVHFTNVNVIHMGDTLFNKIFPYMDFGSGGSLDGYIEAQKTVLGLVDENTKIIPGHGVLANKKDLESSIAMLEDAREIIGKLVDEGKTEEEVVKLNPLAKYNSWSWGFISTEKMTKQVYKGVTLNGE